MRRFAIIVTLIIAIATELVRSDGLNPISAPLANEAVPVEKPYTIRWSPGTPGPVDIRLHFAETQPIYLAGNDLKEENIQPIHACLLL